MITYPRPTVWIVEQGDRTLADFETRKEAEAFWWEWCGQNASCIIRKDYRREFNMYNIMNGDDVVATLFQHEWDRISGAIEHDVREIGYKVYIVTMLERSKTPFPRPPDWFDKYEEYLKSFEGWASQFSFKRVADNRTGNCV